MRAPSLLLVSVLVACSAEQAAPRTCPSGSLDREGVCEPYGVEACAPGFSSDGDGGCAPRLADGSCSGSTIATPGDIKCRKVGVDACAPGFSASDGGCAALAPESCTGPERLALGSAACVPLGDCGAAVYPSGPADALYVDRAYAGADADGSEARPFATMTAALAAVTPSRKTILVAEGKYEVGVKLDRAVEIVGRCATKVSLYTRLASTPVLSTTAALTLRGVSLSGPDVGVQASGSALRVQGSRVEAGAEGIVVTGAGATLELDESLVIGAIGLGVAIEGAKAVIRNTELRDSKLAPDGSAGIGLGVRRLGSVAAEALVQSSVITGSAFAGVYASGAKVTLQGCLIRGTAQFEKIDGYGLYANANGVGPQIALEQTVIEGSKGYGIGVADGELTLDRSVIRATRTGPNPKTNYGALITAVDGKTKRPATLRITRSLIEDADETGLIVRGGTADLSDTIIRDVVGTSPQTGCGLATNPMVGLLPTITLRDSLIERTEDCAINVSSGSVTVERSVIRDIAPDRSGNRFGVGIISFLDNAADRPTLVVRSSLIERVHDAGVLAFGSRVEIDGSVIRDVRQREGGYYGHGVHLSSMPEYGVPSEALITGSLVLGTFEAGINVFQSTATVENTTVLDTRANAAASAFGDGVTVSGIIDPAGAFREASVALRRSRIGGSARAAFSVYEASATVEGLQATCNALDIAIEKLPRENAVAPTLEDRGGNVCGCGATKGCRAASSNLAPVAAF